MLETLLYQDQVPTPLLTSGPTFLWASLVSSEKSNKANQCPARLLRAAGEAARRGCDKSVYGPEEAFEQSLRGIQGL